MKTSVSYQSKNHNHENKNFISLADLLYCTSRHVAGKAMMSARC